MNKFNIWKFLGAVAVCELAGIIGAFSTMPAIPGWYSTLVKPLLSPPSWIFGPVWTLLYFLMGVALYFVWTSESFEKRKAMMIFGVQLFFNFIWSIIFFGYQNPGLALIDIVLLWMTIVWTIISFKNISRTAAWLLAPYILWVSFAIYLNYSIWALN